MANTLSNCVTGPPSTLTVANCVDASPIVSVSVCWGGASLVAVWATNCAAGPPIVDVTALCPTGAAPVPTSVTNCPNGPFRVKLPPICGPEPFADALCTDPDGPN